MKQQTRRNEPAPLVFQSSNTHLLPGLSQLYLGKRSGVKVRLEKHEGVRALVSIYTFPSTITTKQLKQRRHFEKRNSSFLQPAEPEWIIYNTSKFIGKKEYAFKSYFLVFWEFFPPLALFLIIEKNVSFLSRAPGNSNVSIPSLEIKLTTI